MVYHLRTAVSDERGAHVVIIAPVPNTKRRVLRWEYEGIPLFGFNGF